MIGLVIMGNADLLNEKDRFRFFVQGYCVSLSARKI